jgi:hypothetical protein
LAFPYDGEYGNVGAAQDGATAGIGMIIAVDAEQNQTGLDVAARIGSIAQTRLVSMLPGSQ